MLESVRLTGRELGLHVKWETFGRTSGQVGRPAHNGRPLAPKLPPAETRPITGRDKRDRFGFLSGRAGRSSEEKELTVDLSFRESQPILSRFLPLTNFGPTNLIMLNNLTKLGILTYRNIHSAPVANSLRLQPQIKVGVRQLAINKGISAACRTDFLIRPTGTLIPSSCLTGSVALSLSCL